MSMARTVHNMLYYGYSTYEYASYVRGVLCGLFRYEYISIFMRNTVFYAVLRIFLYKNSKRNYPNMHKKGEHYEQIKQNTPTK